VFGSKASQVLSGPALERLAVTNSIPPLLDSSLVRSKITVLDSTALFAEAIRRSNRGESIVELLQT
jgi:ribose-phosphate pyrophosphokinase